MISDGIIITISQQMLKKRGYRNWLRNYLDAMERNANGEDWYYWMRQGTQPKRDINYVYLCIGGKVRFRSYYAGSRSGGEITFSNGKTLNARAWIILGGPVVKAPNTFPMKGFRGFRYTEKLF